MIGGMSWAAGGGRRLDAAGEMRLVAGPSSSAGMVITPVEAVFATGRTKNRAGERRGDQTRRGPGPPATRPATAAGEGDNEIAQAPERTRKAPKITKGKHRRREIRACSRKRPVVVVDRTAKAADSHEKPAKRENPWSINEPHIAMIVSSDRKMRSE